MSDTEIRPFHIAVPQDELDDLQNRLDRTCWTDEIPDSGSEYGVSLARVRHLAEYWRNEFDWRAVEARLNAYPQFTTEIDGQTIHFLHVRGARPDAVDANRGSTGAEPPCDALIVTHGWPGSVLEYLDVIQSLTAAGFDLVIPSIPGFGFSGPTKERGWDLHRIARAWVELMSRLGYTRYGAVGNDGGSMISPEVGRIDPEHVIGVHVTQLFSFPSGDPAELEDLEPDESAAMERLNWFWSTMGAFNVLQSQSPQTLAYALADSPVGLLGWNSQLLTDDLDDDFVVANVALYWFTRTSGSSIRLYYEMSKTAEHPTGQTTVPIGLAGSTSDFLSIRRFAARDHANIVRWNVYEAPGHYLAHQHTDVLVGDIKEFFAQVG